MTVEAFLCVNSFFLLLLTIYLDCVMAIFHEYTKCGGCVSV